MHFWLLVFAYLAAVSFQMIFSAYENDHMYKPKPVVHEHQYHHHPSDCPPPPSCAQPSKTCTRDFRNFTGDPYEYSYSENYPGSSISETCCKMDICDSGKCCTPTPATPDHSICTQSCDCCGFDDGDATCDTTVGLCKVPVTKSCNFSSDCINANCDQQKCCYSVYPTPPYTCNGNDQCCSTTICSAGACRIPVGGSCTCATYCVTGNCNGQCCYPTGGLCTNAAHCCSPNSECSGLSKCCIGPSGPCDSVTDCCVSNSRCKHYKCCSKACSRCANDADCCDSGSECKNNNCCQPPGGTCVNTPSCECCVSGSQCNVGSCCSPLKGACSMTSHCCGTNVACESLRCCSPPGGGCTDATYCCDSHSQCDSTSLECCSTSKGRCSTNLDCCGPHAKCKSDNTCCSKSSGPCSDSTDCCRSDSRCDSTTKVCCRPPSTSCNNNDPQDCCEAKSECKNGDCCSKLSGECSLAADCCDSTADCDSVTTTCCHAPSLTCSEASDCCVPNSQCNTNNKCCSPTDGKCSIDTDCCDFSGSRDDYYCSGGVNGCHPVSNKIACENTFLELICPAGKVLDILRANYGRTQPGNLVCNDSRILTTSCSAAKSTEIVLAECRRQPSCRINATNIVFCEDPCPNTFKYLIVYFACLFLPF